MKPCVLTMSTETLSTVITALKFERLRAEEDKDEDREKLIQRALDEIINQPWNSSQRV